jgi:hypothetical protein
MEKFFALALFALVIQDLQGGPEALTTQYYSPNGNP